MEDRALLATFTVSNLNDAGAGSLRQAVLDANAAAGTDVIDATGVTGTITLTTGELGLTENVSIEGPGASSLTISGNDSSRIFLFGDNSGVGDFEVAGVTLTGGNGVGSSLVFGGAISLFDNFQGNDTLTIRDSVIDGNTAELGGAIMAIDATLNIIDSTISNNSATGTGDTRGGGGIGAQSAVTTLTRVNVTDNTASKDGGGIYNFTFSGAVGQRDSTLTINDSTVDDNSAASGRGGGIFNDNQNQNAGEAATANISGSSVSGNAASVGGGIASDAGTNNVSNSLIAENTAGAGGAGLFLVNSTTRIENSTVSGNDAGGNGGGLENISDGPTAAVTLVNATFAANEAPQGEAINNFAATGGTATLTYANTIFADNTGSALGNITSFGPGTSSATSLGNNISDDATGNLTAAGDQPSTNPMLGALADNNGSTRTHALATGSPAIDAGSNAEAKDENGADLTTDQRGAGFKRISDGDIDGTATVDIGAFEFPRVSQLIVTESNGDTSVSESVGTDSFNIALNFRPTTDVVVQLSGADVTEFVLDLVTLTFTPDNWDVPQTIRVMGIDDRDHDGDTTTTLTVSVDVANSDPDFAATASQDVLVTTTDNEATSTTGQGQSFDNHAPTSVVNYTIALVGLFPTTDGQLDGDEPVLGQIGIVGFNFAPGGSAFADGQILEIVQHSALFSILGTTYGGDGETTFALPDLRGRVPVGADPANGLPLGTKIGSTEVTLAEANLPSHTHVVTGSSATLSPAGENQPFDNRQPALALTPIVARQGTFDGLGEVVWFAGNFVPSRELPADGSLLPIASNTALFSVLGTTYGGDGETSFGLPDLRGRAAIGTGSGAGLTTRTVGQKIGETSTVVTPANLPSHTHLLDGTAVDPTGSSAPLNNLHPALTMSYLVSLIGIFPSQGGGGNQGLALGGGGTLGAIALTSAAASRVPDGFALANGQLLDIASNPALFSLYGTMYGGDGSTTFGLPDLRGRLAAHADSASAESIGLRHGTETVTLTEATMPAHSHAVIPPEEYVVTTAVDEIDFTNSAVSLREAVISANHHPGQQDITFDSALSGATITLNGGQLELVDDVTIIGPGANSLTIDGNETFRIFNVNGGAVNLTISDLTLTRGTANGPGGAVRFVSFGTLTVTDSAVTDSTATVGNGGGIFVDGTAVIAKSTISGNTAERWGGGLGTDVDAANDFLIRNSTISGNTATFGGGVIGIAGVLNISNSTISGNTATADWAPSGGGIWTEDSFSISSSTITGNTSGGQGGGGLTVGATGTGTIQNTVIAGNLGDFDGGAFATGSANNLIGDATTAGGLVDGTAGNIVGVDWKTVLENDGTDPTLMDNGGPTQTVALLPTGRAIDAGDSSLLPAGSDFDQRGIQRVIDGPAANVVDGLDIGAFEFQTPFGFFDDGTLALQANTPVGFQEPAVPVLHNGQPIGDRLYQVIEAFDQVSGTSDFPLTFVDLVGNTIARATYQNADGSTGALGTSVVGTASFRSTDRPQEFELVPTVTLAEITTDTTRYQSIVTANYGTLASITSTKTYPDPAVGGTTFGVRVHFEADQDINLTTGAPFAGNDRFRVMTLSSMFESATQFDANILRFEDATGAIQTVILDDTTPVDQHLFAAPIEIGGWFELVKTPGSTWFPDSPTIHVDIDDSGGLTLGIQGFMADSADPNDDSLSVWLEWTDAPDVVTSGTTFDVAFTASATGQGTPGVTISETDSGTTVFESGATDTFDVVLDAQPTSDVVVTVTSGDTDEVTVDVAMLTFTPSNWDAVQTVTVTGVDEPTVDGDSTILVTAAIDDANSDDAFDPVADQTVSVTNTDDDLAGLDVDLTNNTGTVSEDLTTDNFDVVLPTQPLTDVVITVSSDDTGEATVDKATLTFTPADWNTPQTVTVTGVDDPTVDGSQTSTITVSVDDANSDDAFDGLSINISEAVTDNDTAGFAVTETDSGTSVDESGTTDTFDVVLDAQPVTDVVLTVVSGNTDEATVDLATLTFTSADWDTPQTVTITGVDDSIVDGPQTSTISVTIDADNSDDAFDALASASVSVLTTDDDKAPVNVGNVDGDDDFDANDAFLIHLVQLSGSNTQIAQSKGDSALTAVEIRARITAIGSAGDVDGDSDFDANDSFLIQLVKLAGSDTQIDQSKGASPLSGTQIRAKVNSLAGSNTGQQATASSAPQLAVVGAEPEQMHTGLFGAVQSGSANTEYPGASADVSVSDEILTDFRSWIDVL